MSRRFPFARTAAPVLAAIGLAASPATRAQTTHTVQMVFVRFEPAELTLEMGDTLHWVWDLDFHNVESGVVDGFNAVHDGRFRSGDPDLGPAFDLTFDREFLDAHPSPDSRYPYYCLVHYAEGMTGVIEVVVSGDADRDTDVDRSDHARWPACVTGPQEPGPVEGCEAVEFLRLDADGDGDADLQDWAELQLGFTG